MGLRHSGYNQVNLTDDKYKYRLQGQEQQDEFGLNWYSFKWRNYDSAIGQWTTMDPMAEQAPSWNPYNYTWNNPVINIDPDGRWANPIYGLNGDFLGTDDKGFQGELIFMDKRTFMANGGYNNGTNDAKKGGISHQKAMALGQTLSQVIRSNPAKDFNQANIDMLNNAITHVVSLTEGLGIKMSDLYNGKVSSNYAKYSFDSADKAMNIVIASNDGYRPPMEKTSFPAFSNQSTNKVTFNLFSSTRKNEGQFTVANLQNTMIHEANGHLLNNWKGGHDSSHFKAYELQMNHPTWNHATSLYRATILGGYNRVKQ